MYSAFCYYVPLFLHPSSRFLSFSAVFCCKSTSIIHLLPPLRWKHCLSPARSARVGFLGSTSEAVRFVPHGLSAGAKDLLHNVGATAVVLARAVFSFNDLSRREVLQQQLYGGSLICAFVPLVNCLWLVVNGLSLVSDEELIRSVTRGRKRRMLYYYLALGYMHLDWRRTMQSDVLVSLVATMVESLPISELVDDNISVPLQPWLHVSSLAFNGLC